MDAELAYLFRHGLLRDAAYELHLPTDRSRLHRLAAELIEAVLYEGEDQQALDAYAGELARHYELAREKETDPALLEKQIEYTRRAAEFAERNFLNQQAVEFYDKLVPLVPDAEKSLARRRQGIIFQSTGRPEESVRALQDALEFATDDLGRAESRRLLADVYNGTGRATEVPALIKELLPIYRRQGNQIGRLRALGQLANAVRLTGRPDRADRIYARVRKVAAELNHADLEARTTGLAGSLHYNMGRLEEAETELRLAAELNEKTGRLGGVVTAKNVLAGLLEDTDRFEEAEELYREALALCRRIGARKSEGSIVGNLAILLHETGRLDEAIPLYHLGLQLHAEVGDPHNISISLCNLAGVARDQGDNAEAERLFRDALVKNERAGDPRARGVILGNLAGILRETGRIPEARGLYEEALALHRQVQNRYFEATHLCDLGVLHVLDGQTDEGLRVFEQGADIYRELGAASVLREKNQQLAEGCRKVGIEPPNPSAP